jgi:hypothetical protein
VLFLDECIPAEVGKRLSDLLRDHPHEPDIKHLTDYYRQAGVPDDIWAADLQRFGWLPLTADRGRKNFGRKLPLILRELNVIHISLSSAVHRLKSPEKALAVVACWPKIISIWQARVGCCHSIQYDAKRTCFRLISKP